MRDPKCLCPIPQGYGTGRERGDAAPALSFGVTRNAQQQPTFAPMAFVMQTDTGTVQAYLFECDDDQLFAVSIDPNGRNIPRNACPEGWRFKTGFLLGVHEPVPVEIDPLRRIENAGYYIWREGMSRAPVGSGRGCNLLV